MSTQIERNNTAEKLLRDIGIVREVPRVVKVYDEIYNCGHAQKCIVEIKNGKKVLLKGKPCPLNNIQHCIKISTCPDVFYQKNLIRLKNKASRFEDSDWQEVSE
jgi:hypothetical protein